MRPRLTVSLHFTVACCFALAGLALVACSPTLNWRDIRPEGTALVALLPCKPDKAQKAVPLGGQPAELRMLGCEASGMTFAVAAADVGTADRVALVLTQWQKATLVNMKAAAPSAGQHDALKVAGATSEPAPVLVTAQGQQSDGSPVSAQAAYFAQGTQVFQAVIYGKAIPPDVAQTFFGSLKFER